MPKEIQADLERIIAYMRDSEEAHYQEWFNSDDRIAAPQGEGHIFESVLAVESWLKEA